MAPHGGEAANPFDLAGAQDGKRLRATREGR
jgi:hypothetical protein